MRAAKGPRHGAVAHRWGGKGSRAGLVRPSAEKAARRPHGEESSRRGELTAVLSYSTAYREGWARLFSELQSSRTRDNRHKWQHGKFWRDISIFLIFFFFFIMGEVMHWLLRMFVRSPFLETVKKKNLTGQGLEQPVLAQLWLDWMTSRCPFLPIWFCASMKAFFCFASKLSYLVHRTANFCQFTILRVNTDGATFIKSGKNGKYICCSTTFPLLHSLRGLQSVSNFISDCANVFCKPLPVFSLF